MKRILSFVVLAAMLLASSCSLKEDFKGEDSDFATVSVTVGEPGTVSTRAIGDGTTVNQLHYAVYDEGGALIADLGDVKDVASFPTKVEITLAKGQTYSIVFWAQNSGTTAYSYKDGDLKNITIDYTGANNDETRDAFFKTVSHTVTGDIELDVTLERPFAQINLGVTEEDWNDAKVAGIEVKESEVVISNAATSLDLFNGTVGNGESVTYTASVIPGEDLMVDFDKNGTKEAYKYLSLSYILVCDETQTPDNEGMYGTNSSLVNTTFTLTTTKEDVVVNVENLPVQRNWRTNVIGRMLTGDITFNIDIDPIFDDEENYPDTLEEKLYFAGLNGGTVTLSEDVTLEYPIVVEGAMVVELNGHNITAPLFTESNGVIAEGDTDSYAFWVKEGGDLTINGEGAVKTQACKYSIAVWAQGGNVVINGGDYENAGEGSDLIYASAKGNVIINGGKFTACEKAAGTQGTAQPRSTLNLKDNTGSSIVVYGGSFYKFNPADNASEGPHTNFVAEGQIVLEDKAGEWFTVVPQVINLNKDVVLDVNNGFILNDNLTINFADGVKLDASVLNDILFRVNAPATLTINGKGIVKTGLYVASANAGATVIVNDGDFTSKTTCFQANGGKVYVNDGSYQSTDAPTYLLNHIDSQKNNGLIEVKGGSFKGFNPAESHSENPVMNFVADGYVSILSGEWYTVCLKSEVATIDNTTNVDDLNEILNNSGVVVFEDGIDNTDSSEPFIEIEAGNEVVLNMNGQNITSGSPSDYGVIALEDSEVVINEGIIVSEGGGVAAVNGANVTFNGESLAVNTASTSGRYLFYAEGAGSVITINGGTFSFSSTLNQKRAYVYAGAGTTVYINGGTFGKASTRSGYTAGILGSGTVIITGGTFGFDVTNWVADGYEAVKSGSTWTVSAK